MTVQGNLEDIHIFHTDRGNEFKNYLIEQTLNSFNIMRSLSYKGCPYDNAVTKVAFKIIKTEFMNKHHFANLDVLKLKLADYVNWFDNWRIHSSLDYMTPV